MQAHTHRFLGAPRRNNPLGTRTNSHRPTRLCLSASASCPGGKSKHLEASGPGTPQLPLSLMAARGWIWRDLMPWIIASRRRPRAKAPSRCSHPRPWHSPPCRAGGCGNVSKAREREREREEGGREEGLVEVYRSALPSGRPPVLSRFLAHRSSQRQTTAVKSRWFASALSPPLALPWSA